MSEVTYVKCDMCGEIIPDDREDSWYYRKIQRWAEVHIYDEDLDEIVVKDYCNQCVTKVAKAVE